MATDFKNLSVDYKALLKNTSISDRVSLTQTSAGQQLLSALTPTELANIFPDYYKRSNPDVSGFIEATARRYGRGKPQTPGAEYVEGAKPGKKTGETELGRRRVAGRTSTENETDPEVASLLSRAGIKANPAAKARLTNEQKEIIEQLKTGNIDTNDPRVSFLKQIDSSILKNSGIDIVDAAGGKKEFKYIAPEAAGLTREQIAAKGGGGVAAGTEGLTGRENLAKQTYDAFREAGLSDKQARAVVSEVNRENSLNPKLMFGTHAEPATNAAHGRTNYGIFSWGDPSRAKAFVNYMKENGVMDASGRVIVDNSTYLRQQAKFAVAEMRQTKSGQRFLENRDISYEDGVNELGKHIGWDMAGRHHGAAASYERLRQGRLLIDQINQKFPDLLPPNATPEQIEQARQKLIAIEQKNRENTLASGLYNKPPEGMPPQIVDNWKKISPGDRQFLIEQYNKNPKEFSEKMKVLSAPTAGVSGESGASYEDLYKRAQEARPDVNFQNFERSGSSNCGRGTGAIANSMFGGKKGDPGYGTGIGGNAKDFAGPNAQRFLPKFYKPGQSLPENYVPQIGDVIASSGGNKGLGHIQIWNGEQWVSDFKQGKNWASHLAKGYDNSTLYRANDFALSRINPKLAERMGPDAQRVVEEARSRIQPTEVSSATNAAELSNPSQQAQTATPASATPKSDIQAPLEQGLQPKKQESPKPVTYNVNRAEMRKVASRYAAESNFGLVASGAIDSGIISDKTIMENLEKRIPGVKASYDEAGNVTKITVEDSKFAEKFDKENPGVISAAQEHEDGGTVPTDSLAVPNTQSGQEDTALVNKEGQVTDTVSSSERLIPGPVETRVEPERLRGSSENLKQERNADIDQIREELNALKEMRQTQDNLTQQAYSAEPTISQIEQMVPTDAVLNSSLGRYTERIYFAEQGRHFSGKSANFHSNG
jgi:hypothetical protein